MVRIRTKVFNSLVAVSMIVLVQSWTPLVAHADIETYASSAGVQAHGTDWVNCTDGVAEAFAWNSNTVLDYQDWYSTSAHKNYVVLVTDYQWLKITNGKAYWNACNAIAQDHNCYTGDYSRCTVGNTYWNTCCWGPNDSVVSVKDTNMRLGYWNVDARAYPGFQQSDNGFYTNSAFWFFTFRTG